MLLSRWLWIMLALPCQVPEQASANGPAVVVLRERLLALYTSEAAGYTIFRDSSRTERVELRREPVYVWTNPLRQNGQNGAVFVWTCRGRAEVIGTFFSSPAKAPQNLNHELHSLAVSVLDVSRSGPNTWTPQAPGIDLVAIADAPPPAGSSAQRMVQMRSLTHDFSATTQDDKETRWELRLLPKPLYRYASTDPDVLDGAVFAFVTSAGTDPEVLLTIEARKPSGAARSVWQYGVGRFTDMNVWVRHKGREVFAGAMIPWDAPQQDPKHRYRAFRDRTISLVEEPAP